MRKTLHMAKFDASLSTDWANARNNAELTLTLRLGFRQINPAGGANAGTYNDYGRATEQLRKIIKWTRRPGEHGKRRSVARQSASRTANSGS